MLQGEIDRPAQCREKDYIGTNQKDSICGRCNCICKEFAHRGWLLNMTFEIDSGMPVGFFSFWKMGKAESHDKL